MVPASACGAAPPLLISPSRALARARRSWCGCTQVVVVTAARAKERPAAATEGGEEPPAEGSQEAAAERPTAEAAGEEAAEPTEVARHSSTKAAEAGVEAVAEADVAPRAEALVPGTSKPAPATTAERRQEGPARDALDENRGEERNTGRACPAYDWRRSGIDSGETTLTSVGKVRPGRIGTDLAQHTNGAVLSAGSVFFRRGSAGSGRGLPSILLAPF